MDEKIIINSEGESLEIIPQNMSVEDLRNQAIQSTYQLLDAENISYIIYIDDKFDIESQKEIYKGRLTKLKESRNYILNERFKNIDWDSPTPRFDSLILKLWDDSDNKPELLNEVCTHIIDEESANIIPALEIKSCYGDRIKLMTPDEWVTNKYQIIKDLEEGKRALCLFDFEFQSGNKLIPGRNGAELAKSLIDEQDCTERVVCGIFSHKFTEEQEDETRIEYSTKYTINIKKFYTISKFRFAFDPQISGFAEGIKNLLLLPYVEDLKKQAVDVFQESNRIAAEKISDISPKTFNHIIQKSSLKEGVWEINTLFRLYGILSKEENLRYISNPEKRTSFNSSVKNIREIDKIDTGYYSDIFNEQLISLRESEVYISSDLINSLHLPISNGDIFKIKNTEFILLVQPCNLAMRATDGFCGKRAYNYNKGILIPLKEGDFKKLNSPAVEQVIKPGMSAKVKYADFASYKNIPLDLLDLVVFNGSGKAVLEMNQPTLINEMIHFPWLKRYEYIHKEFLKHEKALIFFNNIKGKLTNNDVDIRGLQPFIYAPEYLKELKISGDDIYDYGSRVFKFSIQRVNHYKSPYSDDLLQKFMLYLSRNAFEHDFTEG